MGLCSSGIQEQSSVVGFRLDFLLTVAVKCVSATDLRTNLDPSQGPLKVLLSVSPLKTERLHPAK